MWSKVKYFITDCSTSCMSVLLSARRFGISQWHYSFRSYKMCYSPFHTFGLLSHHVRLDARGFRRKSPLDGAADLLSKIWQHLTTVSFVSAFIVVFSRKPKNVSGRVSMGPENNLVHFKSVLECLLINSWSSSQHLGAGKRWRVIPSLPSHLVIHFTLVKWFRFGWQDWWGEILALLVDKTIWYKVS